MAENSPSWQLYPITEYGTFVATAAQDGRLGFSLLACLNAQHRFTGAFRYTIFGGGELTVLLPLSSIFSPIAPEFADLLLLIATNPRDVILQQNSAASAWVDVVDMIKDNSALIVNNDDTVEDTTQLLEHLLDPAAKKANIGASVRWMVAASQDASMGLELQMLPVPSRLLNKQNLKQDNAVSVMLKRFHIRSEMFSGREASGPIPLLFVPDRQAASAALAAGDAELMADVRHLNERILVAEHLSLTEAANYMQGRHRAAKGTPAFPAAPPTATASKRQRIQPQEESSPGKKSNTVPAIFNTVPT